MSLTRRLLKELELNEETIERIIAAHVETVDALKNEQRTAVAAAQSDAAALQEALRTEAESHRLETERLQGEFEAFRREVEMARIAQSREAAVCAALRRAGANELAVSLLAMAVRTADEDWDGAALRDEEKALADVRAQYGAFFSQPSPLPTDHIAPPLEGGGLTHEDLRRMSAEEINQNWSQVRNLLHQQN